MDFNPKIPDDEKKNIKKELPAIKKGFNEIENTRKKNSLPDGKVTQEKFMDIIASEQRNIRKCNRLIKKIIDDLFAEHVYEELDIKHKIELLKFLSKHHEGSRNFLLKLYDVASRNEFLKQILEQKANKGKSKVEDESEKFKEVIFKLRERINEETRKENDGNVKNP